MHYEVEVNTARKDADPVWQSMIDNEGETVARWVGIAPILAEAEDQDWPEFRVVAVADDGTRTIYHH